MARAAGKMGWKEFDFWFATPAYFFEAYAGHVEQEQDRTQVGFAQARLVAYYAIRPHLEKNSTLGMADIWPLPWDEPRAPQFEAIDPDELARFEAAAERAKIALNLVDGQWKK